MIQAFFHLPVNRPETAWAAGARRGFVALFTTFAWTSGFAASTDYTSQCIDEVCDMDPYCCSVQWDGYCDWEGDSYCEPAPRPMDGSCPDDDCVDQVCDNDSWCCEVEWDFACETAAMECPVNQVNIAVILYAFSDLPVPVGAPTVADMREMIFDATGDDRATGSVNRWFEEVTDGEIQFSGDVFGWYELPRSVMLDGRKYACDSALVPDIEAPATQDGFRRGDYDYVLYVSNVPECNASWKEDVQGIFAAATDREQWPTYAHELGHALGLAHANKADCVDSSGTRVSWGGSCTMVEYGDGFDMMGSHMDLGHFSAVGKLRLGAYTLGDDVIEVTQTGTYEIGTATNGACNGPRGLRIATETNSALGTSKKYRVWGPDHDDAMFYYLEYRTADGFNRFTQNTVGQASSVFVHHGIDLAFKQNSVLLDMTPDTASFSDAAMRPGEWFNDPSGKVSIRVVPWSQTDSTVLIDVVLDDGGFVPAGGTLPPLSGW